MSESERYPWTIETMIIINKLTPDITGKAFNCDWFLLRQRFEQFEDIVNRANAAADAEKPAKGA